MVTAIPLTTDNMRLLEHMKMDDKGEKSCSSTRSASARMSDLYIEREVHPLIK